MLNYPEGVFKRLDIHPTNLKIQKYNPKTMSLYYKYNNGFEEWIEFNEKWSAPIYDTLKQIASISDMVDLSKLEKIGGAGVIKHYKNSNNFEFWTEASVDEKSLKYYDNLGNKYTLFSGNKDSSEKISYTSNALSYTLDHYDRLIYYKGSNGREEFYEYDEYGNVKKYTSKVNGFVCIKEWLFETTKRRVFVKYTSYTEGNEANAFISKRLYDSGGREVHYEDNRGIIADTKYDGKFADMTVYKDKEIIWFHRYKKGVDEEYGQGYQG